PIAITERSGRVDLSPHGLNATGEVHRNPSVSMLYTDALVRGEAKLAQGGPLVVDTGRYTGRSPKDKFLVREPISEGRIWWGDVNQPLEEEQYRGLRDKVTSFLE